jgi:IS1 family transposase
LISCRTPDLTISRAKVYTDFWEAYVTVIPSKRHEAVGKDSGLTSYIERLNNTLRQRVAESVQIFV